MTIDTKRFTCIGKGGEYAVVGTSSGAGARKGESLIIYRDVTTGTMYHREPENFFKRMRVIEQSELIALAAHRDALLNLLNVVQTDLHDGQGTISSERLEWLSAELAKAKGE